MEYTFVLKLRIFRYKHKILCHGIFKCYAVDILTLLLIIVICSSADLRPSEADSPYETVGPELPRNRAIYQNDVFDGGAGNLKEEGQYEELKEAEIRRNEPEKPYSKLTRI